MQVFFRMEKSLTSRMKVVFCTFFVTLCLYAGKVTPVPDPP